MRSCALAGVRALLIDWLIDWSLIPKGEVELLTKLKKQKNKKTINEH